MQDCIKIETHRCLVIPDKCEQVIGTCSIVSFCASPCKGISWQSADDVIPIFGTVCQHLLD